MIDAWSDGGPLAVVGGTLLDVEAREVKPGFAPMISAGRVEAILTPSEIPEDLSGTQVVEAHGQWVLPGLVDSHFHMIGRSAAACDDECVAAGMIEGVMTAHLALLAGITTVRDAGCKHSGVYTLRKSINSGAIAGPRAFVTGLNPTGMGAPPEWRSTFIAGADEMREVIRTEWRQGADFIKLILSSSQAASDWAVCDIHLTQDELGAAVDEAHDMGMLISAHIEGLAAAMLAVEARLDSIDHGTELSDELTDMMAERRIGYIPTLTVFHDEGNYILPHQREAFERRQHIHRESVRHALRSGVVVAAGSDHGYPSGKPVPPTDCLVRELEALSSAGADAWDVLCAATVNGGAILHRDEIGVIRPGSAADVNVVSGDPMMDIRVLEHPTVVIKEGRVVVHRTRTEGPGASPATSAFG